MSDLDNEGRAPKDIPASEEDKEAIHTTKTTKKPIESELKDLKGTVQLIPTQHTQGNELTVLIQILATMNKNLAFLASAIHNHLNPNKAQPDKK